MSRTCNAELPTNTGQGANDEQRHSAEIGFAPNPIEGRCSNRRIAGCVTVRSLGSRGGASEIGYGRSAHRRLRGNRPERGGRRESGRGGHQQSWWNSRSARRTAGGGFG